MSNDNNIQPVSSDSLELYTQDSIQSCILTIRDMQVIMDTDLAEFYQVPTKVLNQAVKRNIARFPERYRFQLTEEEKKELVTNCDRFRNLKHSTVSPYAFTEQGVTQLSAVLRSDVAVEMSIRINDAFHAMRKFIMSHAGIFQRLEHIEQHQIMADKRLEATNTRIDQILDRMDDGSIKQRQGLFFDNQMFDALVLLEELVEKAQSRIILIDDYVDARILNLFFDKAPTATIDCYVKRIHQTASMQTAFTQFHAQHPNVHCEMHDFELSHDRWLIIDDQLYNFGASLKDLGKRWFSFSAINDPGVKSHILRELI